MKNNADVSDTRGFSYKTIQLNREADPRHLGVRLGRVCLERNISAIDCATSLGVSKYTIYKWWSGAWKPNTKHENSIEKYITKKQSR